MDCLLSIIIPTKNRYSTLLPLLEALRGFNSNDFEVVIQDNSENNDFVLNYLQTNIDLRVKYFHRADQLSVIENSDLAVNNSIGEFICFIGDDDGVMPYIVEAVKWMKLNNFKALKAFKPNYYWPNQKSNYLSNDTSGNLKFRNFNYTINKISAEKALEFTLRRGGTSMEMLPCLYHGIVERVVLESIFKKCTTYFPGPSPDMANAIALTRFIDEFIYVDFPIVISGKSISSTGGQGVLHKHVSKIEDVAHLPKDTAKEWSKEIPKFWTGPTIWAESVLKALHNCGDNISVKRFRYSYLYASIVLFHYSMRKQIFKGFDRTLFSFAFCKDFVIVFVNRSKIFITNRFSRDLINNRKDVKTIGDCINILNDEIKTNFLPFKI